MRLTGLASPSPGLRSPASRLQFEVPIPCVSNGSARANAPEQSRATHDASAIRLSLANIPCLHSSHRDDAVPPPRVTRMISAKAAASRGAIMRSEPEPTPLKFLHVRHSDPFLPHPPWPV